MTTSVQEPLYNAIGDHSSGTASSPQAAASVKTLAVVNTLAYILNVAITYGIGVGGVLDLPSNAEQSLKYQTLVTPIGWAFSIWGIIFISQALWAVWPFFSTSSSSLDAAVQAVGYKYSYVVLWQAAWTFAFAYDHIALSAVVMSGICVSLWWILLTFWKEDSLSFWNTFPLTIHAGWITAATGVNLNVTLVAAQVAAQVQFVVAILTLLVLLGVGVHVTISLPRTAAGSKVIPLVLAWACHGVYSELQESNVADKITGEFSSQQIETIQVASAVCAGLFVLLTIVSSLRNSSAA